MPGLSVFFLRTALLYLLGGSTIGSVLLWQKATGTAGPLWMLRETHIIFLTAGFLLHFVVGTAWWIFPRIQKRRGREAAMIAGYALLNLGIALECAAGLVWPAGRITGLSTVLEIAGLACFFSQLGPRIAQQFALRE